MDVYASQKKTKTSRKPQKTTTYWKPKEYCISKFQLKRAQFLHLACQWGGLPSWHSSITPRSVSTIFCGSTFVLFLRFIKFFTLSTIKQALWIVYAINNYFCLIIILFRKFNLPLSVSVMLVDSAFVFIFLFRPVENILFLTWIWS